MGIKIGASDSSDIAPGIVADMKASEVGTIC